MAARLHPSRMLNSSFNLIAWRLSCAVKQEGAMKLCTRPPTRFMPLLKVHRSSRRHATCTQIAPADHGQLDQVEVYQHRLSLVSPVDTLRYILLNDMRPLLHQMNMRAIVKEAVPPPNPAVSFPINGQMLDPNEFRRYVSSLPCLDSVFSAVSCKTYVRET